MGYVIYSKKSGILVVGYVISGPQMRSKLAIFPLKIAILGAKNADFFSGALRAPGFCDKIEFYTVKPQNFRAPSARKCLNHGVRYFLQKSMIFKIGGVRYLLQKI